jgi:hypothetical protein
MPSRRRRGDGGRSQARSSARTGRSPIGRRSRQHPHRRGDGRSVRQVVGGGRTSCSRVDCMYCPIHPRGGFENRRIPRGASSVPRPAPQKTPEQEHRRNAVPIFPVETPTTRPWKGSKRNNAHRSTSAPRSMRPHLPAEHGVLGGTGTADLETQPRKSQSEHPPASTSGHRGREIEHGVFSVDRVSRPGLMITRPQGLRKKRPARTSMLRRPAGRVRVAGS